MSSSPETSEVYWNDIGGKVLAELERRLGSEADARELPGTLLMRLAEKYLQYLDKLQREEEDEKQYMTALEAIDQEGLPLGNKIEILRDYIDKLEEDHTIALERLGELLKEQHGISALHEPEPPGGEGSLPLEEGIVPVLRGHEESVQQEPENVSPE